MSNLAFNKTMKLPPHIAYSQGLRSHIQYNLSNSCAQSMTLAELMKLSDQDSTGLSLEYAEVQGDAMLRREIAHFHRRLNHTPNSEMRFDFDEYNVLTFCGAQEALAAVYQSVLLPGDEVVVFTPCYPSLISMAESMGVTVKAIALDEHNFWHIDVEELEAAINEKTKIVVINSPHNPTGSVVETGLAKKILALVEKYQCYLIADDVAQASNFNHLALAHDYLHYRNTVVISVMSKSFGLGGVRVGWALTQNKDLLETMLVAKSYGSICCSAVDEMLALIALDNAEEILSRNNQIILDNINQFQQFIDINSDDFAWHPPKAGTMAIVGSKLATPCRDWLPMLAKEEGVLLLPASLFGLDGEYFRLGLGQKNMPEALAALQTFLVRHSL